MYLKQEADFLPLNTDIKRTLKNMRKITVAESRRMEKQRERPQTIPEEEEEKAERTQTLNTMEDCWRPIILDEYSTVRQPKIEDNNFELKLALITMVQQHQFTGHLSEETNEHMRRLMRMTNTVKLNGVRPEVIKLQFFLFSLRDVVATWFDSLLVGSVNSLEELVKAYMSRFFPPALTSERRGEIIVFK